MKARELTKEQRQEFSDYFYKHLSDKKDGNSNLPLGCPWKLGHFVELEGKTIEEMATNYYNEIKSDVLYDFKLSLTA